MSTHENTFRPEDIDADIDQLLKVRHQGAHAVQPKARLVSEMRDLYVRERYREESQVLDRAWERLSRQIQGTEKQTGAEMPLPIQNYRIAKGNRHMQEQGISRNDDKGKTMVKRLSGIGSGLVAALLIASAILIVIYHQQSLSSHSSQTASQHQQTQSQTPAPGTKVPGPASSEIMIKQMGTVTTQSIKPSGQKYILTPTGAYTFHTGQRIGVAFAAKPWQNIDGNNTLKWYQNGTLYKQENDLPTSPAPKGDDSIYTMHVMESMVYQQPGSDKVEFYWGNQLAWTIYFTVK